MEGNQCKSSRSEMKVNASKVFQTVGIFIAGGLLGCGLTFLLRCLFDIDAAGWDSTWFYDDETHFRAVACSNADDNFLYSVKSFGEFLSSKSFWDKRMQDPIDTTLEFGRAERTVKESSVQAKFKIEKIYHEIQDSSNSTSWMNIVKNYLFGKKDNDLFTYAITQNNNHITLTDELGLKINKTENFKDVWFLDNDAKKNVSGVTYMKGSGLFEVNVCTDKAADDKNVGFLLRKRFSNNRFALYLTDQPVNFVETDGKGLHEWFRLNDEGKCWMKFSVDMTIPKFLGSKEMRLDEFSALQRIVIEWNELGLKAHSRTILKEPIVDDDGNWTSNGAAGKQQQQQCKVRQLLLSSDETFAQHFAKENEKDVTTEESNATTDAVKTDTIFIGRKYFKLNHKFFIIVNDEIKKQIWIFVKMFNPKTFKL